MTKFAFHISISFVFLCLCYCTVHKSPKDKLYKMFDADMSTLIGMNADFLLAARKGESNLTLRKQFLKLRLQYKKVEAFAEYFTPTTVKLVNGAPLDEIEDEENAVFEPGGLQVIEELIYTDQPVEQEELVRQVRKMQVNLKRIKALWIDIEITDSQVLDALRLELFRMITLGITGFDTPASGNGLGESKVVLKAFKTYILAYKGRMAGHEVLDEHIERALSYLEIHSNFNDFDRATFIVDYVNPLCRSFKANQKLAAIPFLADRTLLRGDAATLFDKQAFNPENLLSNSAFKSSGDRIAAGQKLFYDTRISGNGKTSCGSCHQPGLAYTDGLKTSKGFGKDNIKRNAPTIMYAALQQAMFYDLRSPSLEDQAADVIHNKEEMHGSMADILRLIQSDKDYQGLFKKAYPELDSIRPIDAQNALATFVRSLSPFNSPFDAYMRGNKKALTDSQLKGFNLFMGKAKCGTCHFMPLFNGTVPPDYQRSESEVLGVTVNADWKNPALDTDGGRGVHNQFPQWENAFKTSTIRNVSKTAPYMHNGAYKNLEDLMIFYNEGGGAGLGLSVPNQTLAPDKLNLSPAEIAHIIDFMKSLTDPI